MRRYAGSCSPEQVHVLQNICDTVLKELQASGNTSTDLLRDVIARRVMSNFHGDDFEANGTARAVLKTFGIAMRSSEADFTSERVMRKSQTMVRSPDRFRALQQVFDAVWADLDQDRQGSVDSREQSRSNLATLVMQHLDHPELNVDLIKQEILCEIKMAGHHRAALARET